MELLSRFASLIDVEETLVDLHSPWLEEPLKAGGWNRKQILGHLIDSASNNHQRFVRTVLAGGLEWPDYDQVGCVRVEHFDTLPWSGLVGLWANYNNLLLHILRNFSEEQWALRCKVGDSAPMTLRELAKMYLDHMQHHLEQIVQPQR